MRKSWSDLLVALLIGGLVAGCGWSTGNESQAGSSSLSFRRVVVDRWPPSGSRCCLDVLALGDLNGDGKPDVVLGSQSAAGWFWYQNPDWKRHVIASGEFTTDGRIADINQDGRMDLVISGFTIEGKDEWVLWWENKGAPTQAGGWQSHRIADFFAHDLLVADVNRDGRPDVVAFGKDGLKRGVFWLENPGQPARPWTQHVIAAGLGGEGLAIGDVDRNGSPDVVASHYLFKNDGRGNFTRLDLPSICTSGAHGDIRPAIADVDRDGNPDIVLGAAEGCVGPVAWFAGPQFTARHGLGSDELRGNHTLEVADFDGDGRLDVLVGEMHTGGRRVIVYSNVGQSPWPRLVLSTSGTHNARISDLDGDGKPDIVGKNYDGSKVVEAWFNTTPKPRSLAPRRDVSAALQW